MLIECSKLLLKLDTIADVATDKLFTQIPSSHNGKIHKLYFEEEEACEVGQVLVDIEVDEDGESKEAADHVKEQVQTKIDAKPVEEKVQQLASNSSSDSRKGRSLASPAVRHLIKEHGLKIEDIDGTGRDGRVLKDDILKYVQGGNHQTQHAQPQHHEAPKATEKKAPQFTRPALATDNATSKRTVSMNGFQKGMQKSMSQALTIPHFNFKDEIDVTELVSDRCTEFLHLK